MHGQYELVASTAPSLPPDPDLEHVTELLKQDPPGTYRWVAYDRPPPD